MVNDNIADMLTRMRNALVMKYQNVEVIGTKMTLGIKEQLIFPEIDYDKIDKIRGMDIVIVTTAKTDEEAREFLSMMGMPFAANK